MKRYLSAIKPTGRLTLGNYIGAISQFVSLSKNEDAELFLFIADLHALTTPIDPKELKAKSIDIVAYYLASGINLKNVHIFLQSEVSMHSELAIIMQNYLYMGELSRMTQFKDKTQKMKSEAIGVGLFTYPILMASDIVLYDADYVPVGEDQIQHVELTRDLVHRFNSRYGEILKLPEAIKNKGGARIMSLSDPTKKMSKSEPKGDIYLDDDLKVARKKIMSAVTDMDTKVCYDVKNKPGISNLMTIYSVLASKTLDEIEKEFEGKLYGEFKKKVADVVCDELEKLQTQYKKVMESKVIDKVLNEGKEAAIKCASKTLNRVKKAVGLM